MQMYIIVYNKHITIDKLIHTNPYHPKKKNSTQEQE